MPTDRPICGIFAMVAYDGILLALAHGWRPVADLGPVHGQWSALLGWCCGDCQDGEAPSPADYRRQIRQ